MIIIADSGSTKTDWIIVDQEKQIAFKTKGVNPLFIKEQDFINELESSFPTNINSSEVKEVYFYAPSCNSTERAAILERPLKSIFTSAKIEVNSDLLAAARSLFKHQKGLACILGTGSNSGYYKDNTLTYKTNSLGYILGDEGSGAHLGLQLIKAYLNQQLDKKLEAAFYQEYKLDLNQIINKVYKEAYPNRFLASFSPFIKKHIQNEIIYKMVEQSFSDFIDLHILPYQKDEKIAVGFVGSVAFHFRDILEKLAKNKAFVITQISPSPIENLVQYHLSVSG